MVKKVFRKLRVGLKVLHDDGLLGFVIVGLQFIQKQGNRKKTISSPTSPKGDIYTKARYEDIVNIDLNTKVKPWQGTNSKVLTFNWLMPPPGKGSGGHLNIFRFIEFFKAGHNCNIYLYGQGPDSPITAIKAIMGDSYPVLNATKGMKWLKSPDSMAKADGVFATSWETAYPLYNTKMNTKKFYFVQDFEPYFYPVGSFYSLAEDTYKFKFYGVTAGNWLATKLARDYRMKTDYFDFGADSKLYSYKNELKRTEILCYVRPFTERRGFENCIIALDLFHQKHPEYKINLVGWDVSQYNIPFPYVNLKTLELDELSELYNKCALALVLSFTNMSLLPLEVLACGTIPVVNEGENNSLVSDNPYIKYSKSNPRALADSMSAIISMEDLVGYSKKASSSVKKSGWAESGDKFVRIVEREQKNVANIIIFGGDGFIGRHLVKKLSAEHASDNIKVFSRFPGYRSGADHPFDQLENVSMVVGDFLNRDDVSSALEGADYVFHLISTTNPASSNNDPLIEIETNLKSTIELLEACVRQKIRKVIYLSSGGTVYGDVDSNTIKEIDLPQPRSPYGIGKLTIEHYMRYFKYRHDLDFIVYRVANPYGPGQNIYGKQGVIPIFLHGFLTNEPIHVYGDGSMVRDYIYIEDLVEMISLSYKSNNRCEVYNMGSGVGYSVKELISSIEKCTEKTVEKIRIDTPNTFVHKSVLNIDRFINEYGFKPTTKLDDGLRSTWEYVKNLG